MFKEISMLALLVAAPVSGAWAGDHPIGLPVEINGMSVSAAYIQAVTMDPMDDICGPTQADVHLTAQIHALAGNANGFSAGEWVPGLLVAFDLTRRGSDFHEMGLLPPMAAQGGPHYGRNMKLDGPGKYHLTIQVAPPSQSGFFRHVDAQTGVAPWWGVFKQEWDFVFVGSPGKKGGY